MNLPEYVGISDGGLDFFAQLGEIVRVLPLLDVVFLYTDGTLVHYQGVVGGWRQYKAKQMPRTDADSHIQKWLSGQDGLYV